MLTIKINLVNGSYMDHPLEESFYRRYLEFHGMGMEGRELVDAFYTDDWGAPPTLVKIVGTLSDGTAVDVSISCDGRRRRR